MKRRIVWMTVVAGALLLAVAAAFLLRSPPVPTVGLLGIDTRMQGPRFADEVIR